MNPQQNVILTGITLDDLLTHIRTIVQSEVQAIPKPEKVKEYLSIEEAAALMNLAKQTVYAMTSTKKIPFIKRGGRILFSRVELTKWLEQSAQQVE